ncbi:MAG: dihydropteroate synthase [Planctomycetota bacterium]
MNHSQRRRFGPDALRLATRLTGTNSEARFVLQGENLSDEERRDLDNWPLQSGKLDSGEFWIECKPNALKSVSEHSPFAALLLNCHAAASPSPAPPSLMGILNVTPDSFSDGGKHFAYENALAAGMRMDREGATWIDVGGESTRPGAQGVSIEEELQRVVPVIRELRAAGCQKISVDTRHADVAQAALEAGALMVNDVGAGLDDGRMLDVVRDAGCQWVLMHRQGTPEDMQTAPHYADPVAEITEFLRRRVGACLDGGIDESVLLVDPGIGFGKKLQHNLDLLARLPELRSLGIPLLVGPSRKSFIGHITGAQAEADWKAPESSEESTNRLGGTAAAVTFCVIGGAQIIRVHDVAVMQEACAVSNAIADRPKNPC